jgi:hypothetical protein
LQFQPQLLKKAMCCVLARAHEKDLVSTFGELDQSVHESLS